MAYEAANENTPVLSVVVPCYKTAGTLPRCLDSLLAQSFDSVEIICVNDGSPDDCKGIIESYMSKYPSKIVLVDQENRGIWHARRAGIAQARGMYTGFVDSDDYVEPNYAEVLVDALQQSGADMVVAGYERTDAATGKVLASELCEKDRKPFSIAEDPGRIIEINTAPWNKAFKTSILKGMHDLDAPPPIFEDVAFHLLAYLEMRDGGKIVFAPRPIVHYMVHEDSNITGANATHAKGVYRAFLEVRDYYYEANVQLPLIEALDAMAFVHLGVSLMLRMSSDGKISTREACQGCADYLDEFFSTWRRSPYFTRAYAQGKDAVYGRMLIAHKAFTARLMPPFLAAYRLVTVAAKKDVKW